MSLELGRVYLLKLRTILLYKYPYYIILILSLLITLIRIKLPNNSKYSGKEKSITGTIKTCKKDAVVDRIGSTEEAIKLTYNSRQCHSKFEIFDIEHGGGSFRGR